MRTGLLIAAAAIVSAAPSIGAVVNKYRYDARGRVVIADQSVTTGAGHTSTYTYDNADNRALVDVSLTKRVIWLPASGTLSRGGSIVSEDGRYRLTMQRDGDAVLFDSRGRRIWTTGTAGQNGNRLVMQSDGHLLMFTAANTVVWGSGTAGFPGASLAVQVDGNLVIYYNGSAVWAIGACPDCS
jgi:hypothetical protein